MSENMMNSAHKDNQNPNFQDNYDKIFRTKNKKRKVRNSKCCKGSDGSGVVGLHSLWNCKCV